MRSTSILGNHSLVGPTVLITFVSCTGLEISACEKYRFSPGNQKQIFLNNVLASKLWEGVKMLANIQAGDNEDSLVTAEWEAFKVMQAENASRRARHGASSIRTGYGSVATLT